MGVTLEIRNSAAGALRPVAVTTVPKADNRNDFNDRLRARAELAGVYARLLGQSPAQIDIYEGLQRHVAPGATAQAEAQALQDGLRAAGLLAQVRAVTHPTDALWPALAYMTSGQVVLVLGQDDGALVIYDRTCPDNRALVPMAEFLSVFAGTVIKAEAALTEVERAHNLAPKSQHWFWGTFLGFRKQLAEIALGSLVANLLAVAVALFSLQIYDRVIPHQSEATLWVLAVGALMALLLEGFIKIARARLMDGAGRQIELSVLRLLMNRILGARSDAESAPPSMRFSQMRDFGAIREFFTATTIGTLADIPFILLFLALVASIAGPVVWVLILGGALMVIPGFFLQRRMIQLTQESQGASARSGRVLQEAIYELDTIKTQRGEDRVMRLWTELSTLSALKSSDQRKIAAALTFWSQGLQQATYVAAVICGTYLVFAGSFTVGSIIAVGILTSRTLAPLTGLAGIMAKWGNVQTALAGLEAIAEAPQDTDAERTYLRRTQIAGAFELREVAFRYAADAAPVLDLPAFKILPGQRLAVLGPNGSGKSTLLKLLSGLYAPSQGRVLIDGTDMGQIAPKDLRRLIGYLGQEVRLFAGTLRDNLTLSGLEGDEARLMAALDFAGLGAFVRSHPKGLDLEIFDGGLGLSVGQRHSIGWARLWLLDPQVCLLDEPTAALDQNLEKALVDRLATWLEGRTAVIATHRVPILALTTRTLVLRDGRMQVDGPQDKVLEHLSGQVVPLRGAAK